MYRYIMRLLHLPQNEYMDYKEQEMHFPSKWQIMFFNKPNRILLTIFTVILFFFFFSFGEFILLHFITSTLLVERK